MNGDNTKDEVTKWGRKRFSWVAKRFADKWSFLQHGFWTWEFWLLFLSVVVVIASPIVVPGLYAVEDTTPNPEPYETIVRFDQTSQKTTYISIKCETNSFITSGKIAHQCHFRFEQLTGSLQTYSGRFVNASVGTVGFVTEWSRREDPDTIARSRGVQFLIDDFVNQTNPGNYTIQGDFYSVAPRNPGLYSFSIRVGPYFGNSTGDSDLVTVFSPAETSTFQTREFLMPFQRLILAGILLSLLKFWIDLLDRINSKIEK